MPCCQWTMVDVPSGPSAPLSLGGWKTVHLLALCSAQQTASNCANIFSASFSVSCSAQQVFNHMAQFSFVKHKDKATLLLCSYPNLAQLANNCSSLFKSFIQTDNQVYFKINRMNVRPHFECSNGPDVSLIPMEIMFLTLLTCQCSVFMHESTQQELNEQSHH